MSETVKELTCIVCPMGMHAAGDNGRRKVCQCDRQQLPPRGKICRDGNDRSPPGADLDGNGSAAGIFRSARCGQKGDIPKELLFDAMRQLDTLCVQAPVSIGQVLVEDLCGTGIPVIATRDIHSV